VGGDGPSGCGWRQAAGSFFAREVVMPGAIDSGARDKIVMIIIAVGILITLFCFMTDGKFR